MLIIGVIAGAALGVLGIAPFVVSVSAGAAIGIIVGAVISGFNSKNK